MSDWKVFPDIREVADFDQDYVDDMMQIVGVYDYLETQAKTKAG